MVWISAPAGAGKTTLIASWLDARKRPALWYQVDEGDGDLAAFFRYLGLAGEQGRFAQNPLLPFLTPEYLGGLSTFARRFFEGVFSRLGPPATLVFDNYQDVPDTSAFHEVIREGLRVIPAGTNVIVISRTIPPPALAPLKADRRMATLGWEDLKLSCEETAEISELHRQRRFSGETVRQVQEMTEGWAAGVILLSEALSSGEHAKTLATAVPQTDLFAYFAEEVLAKADPDLRAFLLMSSLLPQMTPDMAAKLTGLEQAGQYLSRLATNDHFTRRHGKSEPVYQYHALFREFLQAKIRETMATEELNQLRRSAASLLAEAEEYEDAAILLRQAGDWQGFAGLVLSQAPIMMDQGRIQTLEEWLSGFPAEILKTIPWLRFWLGACKILPSPAESRQYFEQTYQEFLAADDMTGALLSWAGAVDTYLYEWDDFQPLSEWIERLEALAPEYPSSEIETRVAVGMAGAIILSRPDHPDIKEWTERALTLSRVSPDSRLRMQAEIYAFNYYLWRGDIARNNLLVEEMGKNTSSPLHNITRLLCEALLYNWSRADSAATIKLVEKGLKMTRRSGIHVWDHFLLAQGAYAALNAGDTDTARIYLLQMEQSPQSSRGVCLCNYRALSTWYNLLLGNSSRAVAMGEMALQFFAGTGSFGEMLIKIQLAQALHLAGERDKAIATLNGVPQLIETSNALMLEYMYLLTEAQFAFDREDEAGGLEYLRRGMTLGRKQGYVAMFWWWLPTVMTPLCIKALEAGIETDYVRQLIKERNLRPVEPPQEVEEWPWLLKIYTLGRFELVKNEGSIQFSTKAQQKPLLLLKALIALGGTGVPKERLSDLLWPDSEGDSAQKSFEVTLLRLRRLLGSENVLQLSEGRLSLDPNYVWVDTWAFERIAGKIENLFSSDGSCHEDDETLFRLMMKGISRYRGDFLSGDEEYAWVRPTRERLRSNFLRLAEKSGNHWERVERPDLAVECYYRWLEVDDTAERIYQWLMTCQWKMGQHTAAQETFERCRAVLFSKLGTDPSGETIAIHDQIRGKTGSL